MDDTQKREIVLAIREATTVLSLMLDELKEVNERLDTLRHAGNSNTLSILTALESP